MRLTSLASLWHCVPEIAVVFLSLPAAPEVARKLLAAGLNVTEPQQVNVSQPGSWSFTVSVDGGAATQGLKNGKAGVIKLPNDNAAVVRFISSVGVPHRIAARMQTNLKVGNVDRSPRKFKLALTS